MTGILVRAKYTYYWLILAFGFIILLALLSAAFIGAPSTTDSYPSETISLWINFLGTLHPIFLHLPIGAFTLLVLMESISILSAGRYRPKTSLILTFALMSTFLALIFGYALYLTGNYAGELIEQHKDQALIFTGLLVIGALFKLTGFYHPIYVRFTRVCYLFSLFSSMAFMTLAGHNGGLITHGDPLDKWPSTVLSQRKIAAEALRTDPVIFEHVVQPILDERCVYCHGADKQEGSLRLDSYAALLSPAENGPSLVSGDVDNSALIQRLLLPLHDDKHMPPTDKPQATAEEIALLTWWVDQGAPEKSFKSDLSVSDGIERALASLVSPAERTAREAANRAKIAAERRTLIAERERLKPLIDAFNANYPGALSYRSSESVDLNFSATSFASTFATIDLEGLLPFADVLTSANLARCSGVDDTAASYIAQLTALRELNLSQTQVGDILTAGLSALPNLQLLNLFGTQISPLSDEPLLKLPAIRTLYVGNTGYNANQTIALREVFSQSNERSVEVVGIDTLPEMSTLTEEGIFAQKIGAKPGIYGELISPQGTVTLSSIDQSIEQFGRLAQFTQTAAPELDFAFQTQQTNKPWVQLRFEAPQAISAFVLKNRSDLPELAEGLVLQRQLRNGSWETIWTSPGAQAKWTIDLSYLPAVKRESTAFRFILNAAKPSVLHLAHLLLWGQAVEPAESVAEELSESLTQTGQDDFTYVVAPHWGKIPGHAYIGPTHGGIVVDQTDRVFVSTDGSHGILVFRRDGTYLKSIAKGEGPYHGLCIHTSEGQEFIYAASNTHMAKYSLSGELIMKIEGLKQSEGNQWKKGTAVAVAPSGEIFIADGYGSSVIFKYSPEGEFLKKFGHRGNEPGQFKVSHGLAVDTRNQEQPLLIVCDRENGRLQLFDMDGNFVRVATEGLRRPCAVSIQNDLLLVAELRGRAVLLDRDYQVVSVLGENPRGNELAKFKVPPEAWEAAVFIAPHGCSFGQDGAIYIQDWNKWGRVTKLLPLKNLTTTDVEALTDLQSHAPAHPALWTPNQLDGLFLWLDAADVETFTISSGRVAQWDDKSGKGLHAYALDPESGPSSGKRTVNGQNALDFFNSRLANKEPDEGNWQDVFVVADWSGGQTFDNYNGLLTGFARRLGIVGDSRARGDGLYMSETWWNQLRVNAQLHDGSKIMPTLAAPFLVNTIADKPAIVAGFSIGNDRKFLSPNKRRDWEGAVCEVIAFERMLNEHERAQVEGYLAHKWGLVKKLPNNHPYKNNPPELPHGHVH